MARIAVLGAGPAVQGYALAGALVLAAADADTIRAQWAAVPADVAVVVLTATAARVLGPDATTGTGPLTVVLP